MLEPIAKSVTIVHRRAEFRAHPHSVELLQGSSVTMLTDAQIAGVRGDPEVSRGRHRRGRRRCRRCPATKLVAALGFTANLGPLMEWGIDIRKRSIVVDTMGRTTVPGIYAAGDIVDYQGKVKLIATGFGEVATAVNNAAAYLNPDVSAFPGPPVGLRARPGSGGPRPPTGGGDRIGRVIVGCRHRRGAGRALRRRARPHPGLAERLFTAGRAAHRARAQPRSAESLAARFAAKEALAKALGAGGGMHWTDAEVLHRRRRPARRCACSGTVAGAGRRAGRHALARVAVARRRHRRGHGDRRGGLMRGVYTRRRRSGPPRAALMAAAPDGRADAARGRARWPSHCAGPARAGLRGPGRAARRRRQQRRRRAVTPGPSWPGAGAG